MFVDQNKFRAIKKPGQLKKLTWGRLGRRDARQFLLLRQLGRGSDGVVFLACTLTGSICALKFGRVGANLEMESEVWNTAWEAKASRVATLASRPALVMPYVKPFHKTMELNAAMLRAVEMAIEKLANCGYEHLDLRWRHVGFFIQSGKYECVLFDLTRVRPFVDNTTAGQVREAIANMRQSLMDDNCPAIVVKRAFEERVDVDFRRCLVPEAWDLIENYAEQEVRLQVVMHPDFVARRADENQRHIRQETLRGLFGWSRHK